MADVGSIVIGSSCGIVPVDVALKGFVLEEEKPTTMWRNLHVKFKEGVGEQESIPSLANTTCPEKGWWWKESNHPI